ncbi:hypothetical protein RS130_02950 [Paraglaciecola aquimarina]|uniref:DNA gyrase subunit B n=1 Tax=Paraglaciecola aquimarina TaxID=1235557 RepID=A0ABU3SSN5_9ALTE|nr:hypothetical protein [Paraglaciecola aquimarina]MDU0353029.1 hypothetical protein [Paraglaciecola aquimarina]
MPILLTALTLLYPILAYLGLQYTSPSVVAGVLMGLLVLRFAVYKSKAKQEKHVKLMFLAVLILLTFSLFTDSQFGIRFYPVAVSLIFLCLFAYSLIFPPTVIERLARLTNNDFSPAGVKYARKVTIAWCLFFVLNGSISFYTCMYSDMQTWTLYNGVISYVLMGILGAAEWLIRQTVKHKH